jgi:hypothetical protein
MKSSGSGSSVLASDNSSARLRDALRGRRAHAMGRISAARGVGKQ